MTRHDRNRQQAGIDVSTVRFPMFAKSLMDRLFGPDPAFLEFLASLTEFARIAEQADRDLSLVKASEFSSQINGRFS